MHFDVSATLYLYYESNTARILIYNNDIVTILQSGPLFLLDFKNHVFLPTLGLTQDIFLSNNFIQWNSLGTVLHTKDHGHNRQVYIMLVFQVRLMAKA